jgi:VWFA-related protein
MEVSESTLASGISLNVNRLWFPALTLTLATGLAAQTPAPPLPSQELRFKAQADVVTKDVIVRDRNGHFVPDLAADEFEVYDGGIKQDIISMTVVSGGRATRLHGPPSEDIALPVSQPGNDMPGRMFLFFIDDLHMDFHNSDRVRELFKNLEMHLLHDGDMWGMVSSGSLPVAIDMTTDKSRFDEAVEQMAGSGSSPTDVFRGTPGTEAPAEVRYRAHIALSTVADVLRALENVHDRRKTVVYVSDGYDGNVPPDGRFETKDSNASSQQREKFHDEGLARDLRDVIRAANRANTTFYTIDPRGFVGVPDTSQHLDPARWQDYVSRSRASLRVLAEETGGVTAVNQNDLDDALRQIDEETSDYYVVGFFAYSSIRDGSTRPRQLQVKVTRKAATGADLNVWSR